MEEEPTEHQLSILNDIWEFRAETIEPFSLDDIKCTNSIKSYSTSYVCPRDGETKSLTFLFLKKLNVKMARIIISNYDAENTVDHLVMVCEEITNVFDILDSASFVYEHITYDDISFNKIDVSNMQYFFATGADRIPVYKDIGIQEQEACTKLPKVLLSDPIVKLLGLREGDLLGSKTSNSSTGHAMYWRYVCISAFL